jgi:hypothetical protein
MAFCIPDYGWAPGVTGPPDWFSTPAAGGNTSLTDPRWVSALRLSGNNSSGEEFFVRAVRDSASNKLFLSGWVQYGPSTTFDTSDRLWIGFKPSAGTPGVLALNYTGASQVDASNALTAELLNWNSATSKWDSTGGPPTWASNMCVWQKVVSGHITWAFQIVIDIVGAGLTSPFSMCFQARVSSVSMVAQYRYPAGMPLISTTLTLSGLNPATSTHWQAFAFAGPGVTCDPGVSIDPTQIGTINMPTHKINLNKPNTFQARPRNDSSSLVNIRARFRLANWGSAPAGAWRDLMVSAVGNISDNSNGTLQANWQPLSGSMVTLPSPPGGTQDEVTFYTTNWHQCMMVVLEAASGSVYFSRDSCVRNMDFGIGSKFSSRAEISVRGVEDGFPLAQRDVYISVERLNVPDKIDDETRGKYQKVQELYRSLGENIKDFTEEQRYVALIGGDLRHLRYIEFDPFVQWVRGNFLEEQLVISEQFFEVLRPFEVNEKNFIELIDRYAEEARRYHEQLSYDEQGQPILDERVDKIARLLLENISYRGAVSLPAPQLPPAEELEQYMPTVRYHVFRDTGLRITVNGVVQPIVEPQPSFGYYLWLDHEVEQWELRLQNADKIAENLYLIRVPTEGEAPVTTVMHAVQKGEEEQIDPPEPIVKPPVYDLPPEDTDIGPTPRPPGCLEAIAQVFDSLGPIGKAIAQLIRSFGPP